MSTSCPFCALKDPQLVWQSDLVVAIRDGFPVSEGHTLVLPRRHVATWFDASPWEQQAIWQAVEAVKQDLDQRYRPDGYNVGFNAGAAAGQTVMHLHVHVIPRYQGDVDDPRGGVRHVIPGKGNYLRDAVDPLATGGEDDPFAKHFLPLFRTADDVAIVSAFVQASGLRHIENDLLAALHRGARVRLVTGDYLNITQVEALETLLDWQNTWREPDDDEDDEVATTGTFESRVVQVDQLPGTSRSFHPKAWHLEGDGLGVAFVGSSNLSRAALTSGIEWNLRVDRATHPGAWERVRGAFEALWARARPLTAEWVEGYARRARARPQPLPPGELQADPLPELVEPHDVQREALAALRRAREEHRRRALVVLATGLGKTWAAAFDYGQLWDELGRQPRLLFVAHRREILRQSAKAYRRLVHERGGDGRVGWFLEAHANLDAPLVFASVAKLSRPAYAERLASAQFDYVVIDEVHHAAAASYRRILQRVDPAFLLGLTATPDRADAADILGIFDDHVAIRADIARGVAVGRLVPFRYFGIRDDIDYENIPWRNRRFDPEKLAEAVQTERRMATLWEALQEHDGTRSLVFCASVTHCNFVADWLEDRGWQVARVYAAPGSDDRDEALERLGRGEIDAICAIDVFNEGVDVPGIDRVVMLRPTESGVVFLQQLGRGLRAAEDKTHLTVVDFVGNHRVFLDRLRTLLSLGATTPATALARLLKVGHVDLPEGCSVDLELEAKDLLEERFRFGGADEVERVYRELRESRGDRPTAGELLRMGYQPAALSKRHGSWLTFVRSEGDLTDDEERAVDVAGAFLDELEQTAMSKSFKLVTLQVLLDAEALPDGMPVAQLAAEAWKLVSRSPELLDEIPERERDPGRWERYWRVNPIAAWTGAKKRGRTWFRLVDDRLILDVTIDPGWREAFLELTREIADYRLAQYRRSRRGVDHEGFVCRVLWNQRDPILKLPSRKLTDLPVGDTDVRLPDGSVWLFRLMKEFCNVARPVGATSNMLPDLLRQWFGPRAGQPGTAFEVRFRASPDGLWVEPVQSNVVPLAPLHGVVAYPDLRAAAGHAGGEIEAPDAERVLLPIDSPDPDLFAVRVAGTSMDGGPSPLRDGDWAVFRLARRAPESALMNRVVLAQVARDGGYAYQIKRLARDGSGWRLRSDNPDAPSFAADADTAIIGRLERAVRPEDLAPSIGELLAPADIADRFGLDHPVDTSTTLRGHRFEVVDRAGQLVAHDQLAAPPPRRPGETTYVFSRAREGLRYLGVGRWRPDDELWALPEVDFATWRAWGEGRGVSRSLPEGALARAQRVVDAILRLPEEERVLVRPGGRSAPVRGVAQRGGLRVHVGRNERSVSLIDIGWVAAAAEDVDQVGGILDEARVNRLRYLEGTPKGSTKWIDTGWALAAWALGAPLADTEGAPRHPVRANGTVVDATFKVERLDGRTTIVVESRGGTRGTEAAVNTEYAEGLELLLARLKAEGLALADAALETAQSRSLSLEDRRLAITDRWPMAIEDPGALRRDISRAQGNNPTRRIRLWIDEDVDPDALARRLEST